MALINWNDSLSVGLLEIDGQHKKLVDLVNKLHEAMKIGQAKEILVHIFKELIDYTGNHFRKEEIYMKAFSYPAFATHKNEHDLLVLKVTALEKELEAGSEMIPMEVMDFLKGWLSDHIQGTDRLYCSSFRQNGVK
ncbi:MAG: bacteriohemerythrin [Rectinemataceae bacterium]